MQKNVKKGFTLIELLVVIAIIAILAAILFPVFARARENARRASCQSNLKQIALGIFMYNQDYDEKLPLFAVNASAGVTSTNPYGWADAMQPYLKSTQIFQCPSETGAPNANPTLGLYSDYWFNSNASGQADANFDAPTVTVLLGDGASSGVAAPAAPYAGSARYYQNGDGVACPGTYAASTSVASFGGAQRHLDGANLAFADGHVKWLKGTTTSTSSAVSRCAGTDRGVPTFRILSSDRLS